MQNCGPRGRKINEESPINACLLPGENSRLKYSGGEPEQPGGLLESRILSSRFKGTGAAEFSRQSNADERAEGRLGGSVS